MNRQSVWILDDPQIIKLVMKSMCVIGQLEPAKEIRSHLSSQGSVVHKKRSHGIVVT